VPTGVKELEPVEGWPEADGSLVFADRVADHTTTMVRRLEGAGVVKVGQTTASEFGGLNVSVTKAHGVTHNPWQHGRTTGGSSAGSAAAVAGGLVPIATGSDGGGSIRIPAGFCGLVGMKGTAGRIPRGPRTEIAPMTVLLGCMARSVRDVARWYDVCAGYDSRDPYSLPRVEGWERNLGSYDLRGKRAVIAPSLGSAVLRPEVEASVCEAAEALARDAGLVLVDVPVKLPGVGFEWAMANIAQLRRLLGDRWPGCKDDMTLPMAFAVELATQTYNIDLAARVEAQRTESNEAMAAVFDEVDLVLCATNPDVAFPADIEVNTRVGDLRVGPENNGALTIPANVVGNPAISSPCAAPVDGLPVGLQVMGRHHEDALLLDLALLAERTCPWPLVVPNAPV
jgi:Asp-tRNA(Asn)/Glu-tRNA(Gln) amidotransferase A subunit family amidase